MHKLFFVFAFFLIGINAFCEGIYGRWYRNTVFHDAELIIDENNIFSIWAKNNTNLGYIEGELVKIRDGYYFSYISDGYEYFGQSCVIIFIERTQSNNIELIVYGDQVGAGAGVYFDGKYEKQKLTDDEYAEKAFEYIIGDLFDTNIIKYLVGNDIEYLLGCFGTAFRNNTDHGVIIEGYMRGAAPYQNGIIKIENNHIYILITDCREGILFRYYSNDITNNSLPLEFYNWSYFNGGINIEKRIIEL